MGPDRSLDSRAVETYCITSLIQFVKEEVPLSVSRLRLDIVLSLALSAVSFIPAVGTAEGHFAVAAVTLRLIAALYFVTSLLFAAKKIPLRMRTGVDFGFVAVASMLAWTELFPAGNHLRETALYLYVAFAVSLLGIVGRLARKQAAVV